VIAHRTFALPAGTFHALELGDRAARPLVFLHGFPDHPPTAETFLGLLARSHRVIAPWLRGYAPSPLAGPYDLPTLAADVIALIDAIGGPVDLVGHDWGAVIGYAVCAAAPARVRRMVTLAIPHPITFLRSFASPGQLRRSWYMGLFQLPGAERMVARDDFALVDRLWRAWSPGFHLEHERRRELHACLAASMPAPLGYYRAILRPWLGFPRRVRAIARRIHTPILQLHGGRDGCVAPPAGDDPRWFAERVLEVVPDLGHFLHLESAAPIAARVTTWLA